MACPPALSRDLPIAAPIARRYRADKVRSPVDVSQIPDRPTPPHPNPPHAWGGAQLTRHASDRGGVQQVRAAPFSPLPPRGGGREGGASRAAMRRPSSVEIAIAPRFVRTRGFHAALRHKICISVFRRAAAHVGKSSGSQPALTSSGASNQKLSVKTKNCPAGIWNGRQTVKQITQCVNNRAGMEAAFPNRPRRGD